MARTIWKFPLTGDTTTLKLPAGYHAKAFGNQRGTPTVWISVDPSLEPTLTRKFTIYGTGHEMPDDPGQYIGTAIFEDGAIVLHAFERC